MNARDRYRGGRHVLAAARPAEPNNYMYENLALSKAARRARVFVSNVVVVLMLLAALAAVCGLKAYQKRVVVRVFLQRCRLHECMSSCGQELHRHVM